MRKHRKRTSFSELYSSTIFTDVYKNNLWGGSKGEFYSGTGSHNSHISIYTDAIANYIKDNQLETIVEIGCGDFNVSSKILTLLDQSDFNYRYVGYDVVKNLIVRNNKLYSSPKIKFIFKDSSSGNLEHADLLIIRQVLQHLNNKSIKKIINKFENYKNIIISEHQVAEKYESVIKPNIDKKTDATNRIQFNSGIYLEREPFNCKIEKLVCSIPENIAGFDASINTYLLVNQSQR
ncbi:class I SAM-dependent methyltransferase [Pedobacter sp. PWIIR3]